MEYVNTTIGEVLQNAESYPLRYALFLPRAEVWSTDTDAVLADLDELDPDADTVEVEGKEFKYALGQDTVVDIVINARMQRPLASVDLLMTAFLYYYDRDAFIDLERENGVESK